VEFPDFVFFFFRGKAFYALMNFQKIQKSVQLRNGPLSNNFRQHATNIHVRLTGSVEGRGTGKKIAGDRTTNAGRDITTSQ
jgi:hypothetical protein